MTYGNKHSNSNSSEQSYLENCFFFDILCVVENYAHRNTWAICQTGNGEVAHYFLKVRLKLKLFCAFFFQKRRYLEGFGIASEGGTPSVQAPQAAGLIAHIIIASSIYCVWFVSITLTRLCRERCFVDQLVIHIGPGIIKRSGVSSVSPLRSRNVSMCAEHRYTICFFYAVNLHPITINQLLEPEDGLI